MSNIVDFVSASVQDKPVAAYNSFSTEMEDRIEVKLQELQQEVRDKLFNGEKND